MFCNLTPEALADYDQIGVMMSHARGAKLFSEGDPARNVFIICFGRIKISSTSRDGKTMILKMAGPGDVMGLSAVLANVPYEVTAEAIEPCQVKTVRKQEFIDFLGRHGIASMHAAQSLSGEYLTVFHDAKRLALSGSAAGRLARLLLDWGRASGNGKHEIRFTMALLTKRSPTWPAPRARPSRGCSTSSAATSGSPSGVPASPSSNPRNWKSSPPEPVFPHPFSLQNRTGLNCTRVGAAESKFRIGVEEVDAANRRFPQESGALRNDSHCTVFLNLL
jgi:CRP/FNR family transcriptional regulator